LPSETALVLGFDTSAAQCAAALVSGDRVLASRVEPMDRGQAERLLPMLEEVLSESGGGWSDLAALAVCTGPGNFTGIRVGVAAARGLALGLDVPAIGVTAFEAHSHGDPARRSYALLAQGRWYCQTAQAGAPVGEPRQMALAESTPQGARSSCTADSSRSKAAPPEPLVRPGPVDPAAIAFVGASRLGIIREGPASRPVPFYLRDADAAPPAEPPPRILDDDA
jgi:tRNA threonylcarbamoyladenosine biosynthesis protein TsaB